MSEENKPMGEKHEFQTEVQRMLEIVIHSLYTDRQIFLRELISNASDALEKLRLLQLTDGQAASDETPLEIDIEMDDAGKTLTIRDTGIGMTREELVENLGTIARSGSRAFLEQLKEKEMPGSELIGRFGVGFYSSFMVAEFVTVKTRSAAEGSAAWQWTSDGLGEFTIVPLDEHHRGTTIQLKLKEDAAEYAKPERIREVLKEYSSFVSFPVKLRGDRVNTVEAIWTRNRSQVEEKEYEEFYKYLSGQFDKPRYTMHFNADAPISIHSLLFVPSTNRESFMFERLKPGVHLYCRKVMISKSMEGLLPEWLRFLHGIVDSEDLPLNISRETLQDSALVRKISRVITRRFLKFLKEQAEADADKYMEFHRAFGVFLKEGILNDEEWKDEIVPLLRFESSALEAGKTTSLPEYVSRMKEDQEQIVFLTGKDREYVEKGPFLAAFKERGVEVLYAWEAADDFVFTRLGEFDGKTIISAESPEVKMPGEAPEMKEMAGLVDWLKELYGDRVTEVKLAERPLSAPAAYVSLDAKMTARMQKIWLDQNQGFSMFARTALEVNPHHALVERINDLRQQEEKKTLASLFAHQLLDNAQLRAGMLQDPHRTAERIHHLLGLLAGVDIPWDEPAEEKMDLKSMMGGLNLPTADEGGEDAGAEDAPGGIIKPGDESGDGQKSSGGIVTP